MKSPNMISITGRIPVTAAPNAAPASAELGDRGVEDAIGAEALQQARRDGEHAARLGGDVLAEEETAGSRSSSSAIASRIATLNSSSLITGLNSAGRRARTGSGSGAASARLDRRARARCASSRSTSASSSSRDARRRAGARARASAGRAASQRSTSSAGRYGAGSDFEWPKWRYVWHSSSVGPSPARARSTASAAASWTAHKSLPSTTSNGIAVGAGAGGDLAAGGDRLPSA